MTSVLSLTVTASGGTTNTTSALFVVAGQSFSAISMKQLSYIAPLNSGAAWTLTASVPVQPTNFQNIPMSSLQWDTGSWTDSNSVGLFVIRNDKWETVEVGWAYCMGATTSDQRGRITKIVGNNSQPEITRAFFFGDTTNNIGQTAFKGFMRVDSGDVIAAQMYNYQANTLTMPNSYGDCFWIRGVKARG